MKDKQRFSLRFYFTLVVMAEITFSIIIALLLLWLFNSMGNDLSLIHILPSSPAKPCGTR